MAKTTYCSQGHGPYDPKKGCPKCTPPKKSTKYGGKNIHIPPHMKA